MVLEAKGQISNGEILQLLRVHVEENENFCHRWRSALDLGKKKKEETNNDSQFPVLLGYFISNSVMNVAISLLAIAQKILSSIDAAA